MADVAAVASNKLIAAVAGDTHDDVEDVRGWLPLIAASVSVKNAVADGVRLFAFGDVGGITLVDSSRRHVVGVNKRKSHGCSLSDDDCWGDEWQDVCDVVRKSHAEI